MTPTDENTIQVNINALEQEIKDIEEKAKELRAVLSYLRKKRNELGHAQGGVRLPIESLTLGIEPQDINYLSDNLLKKSQARIYLHMEAIKRSGKPVHYKDFCKRVAQLGDSIKPDSYYATINRVAEKYGMKKVGHGFFDLK